MRDIAATENGMFGCRLASVIFLSDEIQDRGNEGNFGLSYAIDSPLQSFVRRKLPKASGTDDE